MIKRTIFFLLLSLICLALPLSATECDTLFRTQPYLQNATPTAMTVMWIAQENCDGWVEYGETPQLGQKAVQVVDGVVEANAHIHRIRLSGLKPGSRYYYKAFSRELLKFEAYKKVFGRTFETPLYSFVTPQEKGDSVSAWICNDLHSRGESIEKLLSVGTTLNRPNFVYYNGDVMSYFQKEETLVNSVLSPSAKAFASEIPYFYGRGNHETRGALATQFYNYFETPDGKTYWAMQWGPVCFIVLDSGEDKPDDDKAYYGLNRFDELREAEGKWFESLAKTSMFKSAKYRVVLMHIPPYHSGDWHGPTECSRLFLPLFNRHKVDMVISGHTHKVALHQPQEGVHNFPILLGGGPKDGQRTIIKLDADKESLRVKIEDETGEIVHEITK